MVRGPGYQRRQGAFCRKGFTNGGREKESLPPRGHCATLLLLRVLRVKYVGITDDDALEGFKHLSRTEGVLAALETSHAVAATIEVSWPQNPALHVRRMAACEASASAGR